MTHPDEAWDIAESVIGKYRPGQIGCQRVGELADEIRALVNAKLDDAGKLCRLCGRKDIAETVRALKMGDEHVET
jgi:hypothetical protein